MEVSTCCEVNPVRFIEGNHPQEFGESFERKAALLSDCFLVTTKSKLHLGNRRVFSNQTIARKQVASEGIDVSRTLIVKFLRPVVAVEERR